MRAARTPAELSASRGPIRRGQRGAYALAALVVFGIEVVIALFVRDRFIRPYLGDALVIGLIYLTLRAATPMRVLPVLAITLAIAFAVEFAQALNLIDALGLRDNAFARVILGSSYDLRDFVAYTAGGVGVLAIETVRKTRMQ
ncbi:DUF2809 domain-containing protein [Brevundimonas sp. FT23042]|uniref:ribosomal maturation YjgA family protein n=1 Tax=Brevundimonas sp. FT23042 TaxID=3393749 RepID=UPI003B585F6D